MGTQVHLLSSLPRSSRNLAARAKIEDRNKVIEVSRRYGAEYFDGPREYGYGGYYYDGRWRSVARDIIKFYNLPIGARILDVGCAKGFLVTDLCNVGMDAYGLDISKYAVKRCSPGTAGRLQVGDARDLPFPANEFDLVLSINTIHNLGRHDAIIALQEMSRVRSRGGKMFVQVDSYETPEQREAFLAWVLTAQSHGYPEWWRILFAEAGYEGDYDWTIVS